MRALLALMFAAALAAPADAAVFRDVVYVRGAVDDHAQSLDVYTPATPGPHALALYVDGSGDKGAVRGRHSAFNAHGMVFVSASFRLAPAAAARDDLVALLAWAQRYASRYGGDPERIHLLAAGAAAPIALDAVDDAARRATLALADGVPAAIVALAPPHLPGLLAPPSTRVPRLLLYATADDEMQARVDAYVERARGAGIAALALPGGEHGAAAIERDFGTPTDPDAALVLAWLDSRAIARVPRFEQLVFRSAALPPGATRVDGLAAVGDTLLVATSGDDDVARIAARDARGGAWREEIAWPGAARVVALLAVDGVALAMRVDAAGAQWCRREGGAWPCMPVAGLVGVPAQVLPLPDAAFVLSPGADGGLFRLAREGDRLLAQRDTPDDAPISRIVACDGALLAASGGALWRRDVAGWVLVARWLSNTEALAEARVLLCVPDPGGTGRHAILAALADGRVLRIDPGRDMVLELDAGGAFRDLWREPGLRASFPAAVATSLRQPDSGDVVDALSLSFVHAGSERPGAYWLLRAPDASWSYGVVRDFDDVQGRSGAIVAAAGAGRVVLVAVAGPTPTLLLGELPSIGPHAGLWWDSTRPGEAIELAHDGDAWTAIVHDHDGDGLTRWTQHAGTLRAGVFVEGGETAREGALRIAFAGDGSECRAPRAAATIARDQVVRSWCLEPFVLPGAGRPAIDGSGTWRSTTAGERWEISAGAHGFDGATASWVMLRWIDEQERPRWLFGVAPQDRGALRVELDGGHCAGCSDGAVAALDVHWLGACGEGAAVVSLELRDAGRIVLNRDGVAIAAVARQPCY